MHCSLSAGCCGYTTRSMIALALWTASTVCRGIIFVMVEVLNYMGILSKHWNKQEFKLRLVKFAIFPWEKLITMVRNSRLPIESELCGVHPLSLEG